MRNGHGLSRLWRWGRCTRPERTYALDKDTGCVRWAYRASAEVRTPVIIEGWERLQAPARRPLAYFADLIARVYAVDATTGKLIWVVKADDHPNATVTGAPVLYDGRLYVPVSSLEVTSAADPKYPCCSFRGSVLALDGQSGATLWKSYTIDEPPRETGRTTAGTPILAPSGAPVWNSQTIDAARGLLYVGTGENYSSPANDRSDALLAFELATGRLAWHRQKTAGDAWNVACMMLGNPNCPSENGPDVDFGASAIIARDRNGRDLLAGRNPVTSTHSTSAEAASPCGTRRSGAAASRAAYTLAWRWKDSACSCRSRTCAMNTSKARTTRRKPARACMRST
jgi:polyvinyl alcohol dehydrogenase (cytochrome)